MDDDLEFVQPIRNSNGTYENPFPTFKGLPSGQLLCKFFRDRMSGPPKPTQNEYEQNLPIQTPNVAKLANPPKDKLQYMWIGHASVLFQMGGWNILSDPIWSQRCSPLSFMGPKRYRPTPLTIDELPPIDAVVISHNHYDHLDLQSVIDLNRRFGNKLRWFVPEGLTSWFHARGCEEVTELTWWQSQWLKDPSDSKVDLEVVCTPAQHWSLRSGFDRNKSLWSSWVLKTSQHSVWFSGDTGYCNAFEVIGKKYGPFDLSAIAIGAYCPRYFMAPQHVDPEQAFQIHKDLRSKYSIGIHWGTFPMGSTEPFMEPKELIEDLQRESNDDTLFTTVQHGAVLTLD